MQNILILLNLSVAQKKNISNRATSKVGYYNTKITSLQLINFALIIR